MAERSLARRKRTILSAEILRKRKQATARKPVNKPAKIKKQPKTKKFLPVWIKELDAVLTESCAVWRDDLPLTNDGTIEKSIYRIGMERRMKASKRIVTNLLRKHKGREQYLRNLMQCDVRYSWEGEAMERISTAEKDSAGQKLAAKFSQP